MPEFLHAQAEEPTGPASADIKSLFQLLQWVLGASLLAVAARFFLYPEFGAFAQNPGALLPNVAVGVLAFLPWARWVQSPVGAQRLFLGYAAYIGVACLTLSWSTGSVGWWTYPLIAPLFAASLLSLELGKASKGFWPQSRATWIAAGVGASVGVATWWAALNGPGHAPQEAIAMARLTWGVVLVTGFCWILLRARSQGASQDHARMASMFFGLLATSAFILLFNTFNLWLTSHSATVEYRPVTLWLIPLLVGLVALAWRNRRSPRFVSVAASFAIAWLSMAITVNPLTGVYSLPLAALCWAMVLAPRRWPLAAFGWILTLAWFATRTGVDTRALTLMAMTSTAVGLITHGLLRTLPHTVADEALAAPAAAQDLPALDVPALDLPAALTGLAVGLAVPLLGWNAVDKPSVPYHQALFLMGLVLGFMVYTGALYWLGRKKREATAREFEQQVQVLAKSNAAFKLFDATGSLVWFNRAANDILIKQGLVPEGVNVFTEPRYVEEGLAVKAREVLEAGVRGHSEFIGEKKQGGLLYLHHTLDRVILGGQPHLLLQTEDMTEQYELRARVEADRERLLQQQSVLLSFQTELEEKNFRLNTVLEHSLVCLAEFEGRSVKWINQGCENILGRTPEEMIGQSTRIFFDSDETWANLGKRTWAAHSNGMPFVEEVEFQHKDGSLRWVTLMMRVMDPNATPMRAIAAMYDITDRKRLEAKNIASTLEAQRMARELRAEKYRVGKAMDVAKMGSGDFDLLTKELKISEQFFGLLGYHMPATGRMRDELIRRIVHPDDLARSDALILENLHSDASELNWNWRVQTAQGTTSHIDMHVNLERDASGQLVRIVGIYHDITKAAERELALEKAVQDAQAAAVAKQQFLATISHELRTPLNGIMGTFELLQRQAQTERGKQYVETGLTSSKLLFRILGDLLDFAKIEAGRMDLDPQPNLLSAVFSNVDDILQNVPRDKAVGLSVQVGQGLDAAVMVDDVRLKQVLLNLGGNALKFTHQGQVSIRAERVALYEKSVDIRIVVSDTGIGMTPATAAKIFSPFTQAEAGHNRKYGGTGLGLSISQRLAEAMRSRIEVQSELDKGSTFSLLLNLPLSEPYRKENNSGVVAAQVLRGLNILVVDDLESNRLTIVDKLKDCGATVAQSSDGARAIQLLEASAADFDLVFMDIQMPMMDGLEATQKLRHHVNSTLRKLPVVAVTGNASDQMMQAALEAGMNEVLYKPVSSQALVEAALRQAQRQMPPLYPADMQETGSRGGQPLARAQSALPLQGKHILVVDDLMTNRLIAHEFLKEMGATVYESDHGDQAVAMLRDEGLPVDLVFMDLVTPSLGGLEAVRSIRSSGKQPLENVPIVALTGSVSAEDLREALDHGMNDILEKPFAFAELRRMALKMLG